MSTGTVWLMPDGISANLLTPLLPDGDIDEGTLRRFVEFHVGIEAVTSLAININLSESHNMTLEERERAAEIIVDQAAGRVGTIVTVSALTMRDAIRLTRHATEIGADAIMSVPPYDVVLDHQTLLEFYRTLADATHLSLIGYHIPSWQSGAGLHPDLVVDLVQAAPNFVGIKDASFQVRYQCEVTAAITDIRPDFSVTSSLEWLVATIGLGTRAANSAVVSLAPNLVSGIVDATAVRDWDGAREHTRRFVELWSAIYPHFPASLKVVSEEMGRPLGPMREPFRPMPPSIREQLVATVDRLGLRDTEPVGWGELG